MGENWKTELMEFVFYLVNPNESHVPQIYTDFELAIAREITGAFTHKGLGGTHISLYMDSWNNVSVTHHWLGVGQVIEVYSIQLSPEALFLELERRCRAIFESFSEGLRAAPDNPNGWSWLYCASNQLDHLKYIRQKHICVHQIEGQRTHYFGGYEEPPGSYVECKACGERLYDYYMYEAEEGAEVMSQVKWEDLRPAYQQTLLHVHLHGTLPEDTPECYEVASSLIANYQFMKLVPASLTVHPGEEYCLTDAGKELMSTRDAVTEDSDSDDPLTGALLEGDYAGIRKLFEELKAERDAANKRRSEVDADAAALRSALEYYTDAEIVTNWGNQETQDDGAVARDALRSTAAGVSLTNRLEYLEGMNLGRERVDAQILELVQKHAPYVEYEELASPQLVEAIDKHISEMAVRITELPQPKQAETLEQLEARAMEFVKRNQRIEACKVFRSANYSTSYANAAVNRMFDGPPTYTQLEAERDELKAMLLRSEERAAKAERTLDDIQHDVGVFAECGLNMSKDDKESLRSDDSIDLLETWQQEQDKLRDLRFELRETTRLLEKRTRQAVRFMNRAKRTHAVPSLTVQKLAMARILCYPPVRDAVGAIFDQYLKSRTCPFCDGEGVAEPDCDQPLHVDGCIIQDIEMWHEQIWRPWMEGGAK